MLTNEEAFVGINWKLSNEDYQKQEGISRSDIVLLLKSPAHYINKKNREITPQMIFGQAFHTYMLEYDTFYDRVHIYKKINRTTKEGKENWKAVTGIAIESNKILISEEELDKISTMASIINNSTYGELLRDSRNEASIFWRDKETNLICKARPDAMQNNFIVDLKVTNDASEKSFINALSTFGYHIQAAMIQQGIYSISNEMIYDFLYVCIEPEPPYHYAIYPLSAESIQQGHRDFRKGLSIYKKCVELQEWPSYGIKSISLPRYLITE